MKKFTFTYQGEHLGGTMGTTVTAHVIAKDRRQARRLVGPEVMSKKPSIVEDTGFDLSKGVVYFTSRQNPK